jgi:hypothetical protein
MCSTVNHSYPLYPERGPHHGTHHSIAPKDGEESRGGKEEEKSKKEESRKIGRECRIHQAGLRGHDNRTTRQKRNQKEIT